MTNKIQTHTSKLPGTISEDMTSSDGKSIQIVQYGRMELAITDKHRALAKQAQYSPSDHARVIKYASTSATHKLLDRIRTIEDLSRNLGAPTLRNICDYDSDIQAASVVGMIINSRLKLRKTDKPLDPDQFKFLIPDIIMEHPHLSSSELIFAMTQGIRGRYGAIYNTVQIDTIYAWIDAYYHQDKPTALDIARRRREEKKLSATKSTINHAQTLAQAKELGAKADKILEAATSHLQPDTTVKGAVTFYHLVQYCNYYQYDYDKYVRRLNRLASKLLRQRDDITIPISEATLHLSNLVLRKHNDDNRVNQKK